VDKRLLDHRTVPSGEGEPVPQVTVLRQLHRLVVSPDLEHRVTPEHDRRVAKEWSAGEERPQPVGKVADRSRERAESAAVAVPNVHPDADDSDLRPPVEQRYLTLDSPWKADVVVVEPGDVRRACRLESTVERRGLVEIPLIAQQADARVGVGLDDRDGVVRRSVVHDQELEVREGLREYAVDRLANVASTVVHGQQYRHPWILHSCDAMHVSAPRVSVLMPVYNGGPFLREAVDSVLAQTFPDFELIVIDDGSTDGSPEVVESYAEARIVLVRETHRGLVATLNRGLELTRGEYVARMDSDDVAEPRHLERLVALLDSDGEVVLASSGSTQLGGTDGEILPPREQDLRNRFLLRNSFAHGAIMLRRSALALAGRYRTDYPHNEDYDLWRRLSAVGRIAAVSEPLYAVRVHPGRVSVVSSDEQVAVRERLRDELWAAYTTASYRPWDVVRAGRSYRCVPGLYDSHVADQWSLAREALHRRRFGLAAKSLAVALVLERRRGSKVVRVLRRWLARPRQRDATASS
jgi:glycosyltransferase involved in cell wall biosynthesis